MSEVNGEKEVLKRAYLCQPYSYDISPEASDSRWQCADGVEGLHVKHSRIRSTGLCESFNTGVVACKNGGEDGKPFDYFAMIHADVEAPAGWLGVMINALEEHGLDYLHAAVAIKDKRGLSSTAIAYGDEPATRKRRLAIREVMALPPVFTIEDVQRDLDPEAKILLPNPGCMVMRCDPWFYDWPGFHTLNDVYKHPSGQYVSRFISEDYVFGYYAAKHGIKIGCTTKVRTNHIGRWEYSTQHEWGMECDRDYFLSIGQPAVGDDRWLFPEDVAGWLMAEEGVALAKLAGTKRVLEIGSYCGRSTICMSQTAAEVVAVDPHDGRATTRPRDTFAEMQANLAKYKCKNVEVVRQTGAEFAACHRGKPFDLVFIDGAHDYESVKQDIANARGMLKLGGLIAFHDYRTEPFEHDGNWDAGVTQAVDEFIGEGAQIVGRAGTVAVVRPPAFIEAPC